MRRRTSVSRAGRHEGHHVPGHDGCVEGLRLARPRRGRASTRSATTHVGPGWSSPRGLDQLRVGVDADDVVAARVQDGRRAAGTAAGVQDPRPRRHHRVDEPRLAAEVDALGAISRKRWMYHCEWPSSVSVNQRGGVVMRPARNSRSPATVLARCSDCGRADRSEGSMRCRCQRSRLMIAVRVVHQVLTVVDQQLQLPRGVVVAWRPAGRARAARPGPRPGRRSGRTCRGCARCGAARPSSSAAPAPPAGRRRAGRPPAERTGARQSSMPQVRSAPNRSRPTGPPCRGPCASALTVSWPSCRPASSTATNVCVRLWTSVPTTTMRVASFHQISDGTVGPVGGHISVGAMPRSYQVTPAGPSHPAPAKRTHARPKSATRLRARRQMRRIQPPQQRQRHPDTRRR